MWLTRYVVFSRLGSASTAPGSRPHNCELQRTRAPSYRFLWLCGSPLNSSVRFHRIDTTVKCPLCDKRIPPLRVWLISRWTFIRCPSCKTLCNRALDLQFGGVSLLLVAGLALVGWGADLRLGNPVLLACLAGLWILLVMLVDAATIRLSAVRPATQK